MRTLKRLFWILVLLAVVAAIGLHGFVRSTPGKAAIAKRISQATGLKATVGEARLSGCALALSDVKVWFAETDGAERVVLAAPEVVVSRLDGRRKIVLARPEINGFQSALSDWSDCCSAITSGVDMWRGSFRGCSAAAAVRGIPAP